MKRIYLFIISVFILFLGGCSLFFDKDTTMDVSEVSVKPYVVLVGDYINSIPKGGNYVEQGVLASEVKEGDNDLTYEIVEGEVDTSVPGFYVVTYKATNKYGWSTYAYRAVLVYEGNPDEYTDISGSYRQGTEGSTEVHWEVERYPDAKGFWMMENVYSIGNPISAIVADLGNATDYMIVPDFSPTFGRYEGIITRATTTENYVLESKVLIESEDEYQSNYFFLPIVL